MGLKVLRPSVRQPSVVSEPLNTAVSYTTMCQFSSEPSLFQYSTISALLAGQVTAGICLKNIVDKGTIGLGTFEYLDGEMIYVDGVAYRIQYNGSITPLSPDTILPFAAVSGLEANVSTPIQGLARVELFQKIATLLPGTKNSFLAVRFDGKFKSMCARTAKGIQPGQNLTHATANQKVLNWDHVEGTMVGFYTPDYYQGISVAGYHLHYLSHDKGSGGHCLDFEIAEGQLQVGVIRTITNVLPDSLEFGDADLTLNEQAIVKAEGK